MLRETVERMFGQGGAGYGNYGQGGQRIAPGTYDYQPTQSSAFMINPGMYAGDEQASRTAAAVARAQYEDYKRRFVPIRNMLVEEATTGYQDVLKKDLGRTRTAVASAYDSAEGQNKRKFERYGVNTNIDTNQDETTSMVGGLNLTRQRSKERKMALAYGGMNAGAISRGG